MKSKHEIETRSWTAKSELEIEIETRNQNSKWKLEIDFEFRFRFSTASFDFFLISCPVGILLPWRSFSQQLIIENCLWAEIAPLFCFVVKIRTLNTAKMASVYYNDIFLKLVNFIFANKIWQKTFYSKV